MRFKKRTLIMAGLGMVLVVAAGLIIFFHIFAPLSSETLLKIMSDRADLEVQNVLYREVGGDGTKWEIRAKKAIYLRRKNQASFDQVKVNLFLPDGKEIVLTGYKGQLDTATREMKILGNVIIISASGERFATDYLQYSADEQRLHTEAEVRVETPRMKIQGVGMSLSLLNKDIVLFSKVHARIEQMRGK